MYVLCAQSLSPEICCVLLVALFMVNFQLYHSQQAIYVIRVQGDDLAYLFDQVFITGYNTVTLVYTFNRVMRCPGDTEGESLIMS